MRKRSELNAADKLYIENNYNTPTHLISAEINLRENLIDDFKKELVKSNPEIAAKRNISVESLDYNKKSPLHKLMGSPKVPNITIMTPAAAEQSDELTKRKTKYFNKGTIHKIKE